MSLASMYIDGDSWEIAGEIEVDFLGYENSAKTSLSGKPYPETEAKPKTVSVSEVMANPDEVEAVIDWLQGCKAMTRFTATIATNEGCSESAGETIYSNCFIIGKPKYNQLKNTIDSFEFAYQTRTKKG